MKMRVVVFTCLCLVGSLLLSQDHKRVIAPDIRNSAIVKQKLPGMIGPFEQYRIVRGTHEFVVTRDFVEHCAAYRAEKSFTQQQDGKAPESPRAVTQKTKLQRSSSMIDLASPSVKKLQKTRRVESPRKVAWDITALMEDVFSPQKLKDTHEIDIDELIQSVIDIACNKKDPAMVQDKAELFMIIKIADLLGHDGVMKRCNRVLIERLVGSFKVNPVYTLAHGTDLKGFIFIPGTTYCLIYLSMSKKVICFDYTGTQAPREFEHEADIKDIVVFSKMPYFLVAGSQSKKVVRFDATGKEKPLVFEADTQVQGMIANDEDVSFFMYGLKSHQVFWCDATGKRKSQVFEYVADVKGVAAVHGTPYCLVHGDKSNKVMRFDAAGKEKPLTFEYEKDVWGVTVLSGAPRFLVYGGNSNQLNVYDYTRDYLQKKEKPLSFECLDPVWEVKDVVGTPYCLAHGWQSKRINCFNYMQGDARGKKKPLVFEHPAIIRGISISNGSPYCLVSGIHSKTVICYDCTGIKKPLTFEHDALVSDVVMIPNTTLFLVCGGKKIRCFDYTKDYSSGKEVAPVFDFGESVFKIVVAPEYKRFIVSGMGGSKVMCFDYTAKDEPLTFEHTDDVRALAALAGKAQVLVATDTQFVVWDMYPTLDLSFDQVELCYRMFMTQEPLDVSANSEDERLFLSLPQELRDQIEMLNKIHIVSVQK